MNGRKFIEQLKLQNDTEKFKQKLYYSTNINFFTTQIKELSSKLSDISTKKNIIMNHYENTEDILKYYIAELNSKIFPHEYEKNYGDENIKINISNLKSLDHLQRMKKNILIQDRKNLNDNIKELIEIISNKNIKKIKQLIKRDIFTFNDIEKKRKEIEEVKLGIKQLLNNFEIFNRCLKETKFLYEQIRAQNNLLQKILDKEKLMNEFLKKNHIKKQGETEVSKDINKNKKVKEMNNFRSLSENNFLKIYKSENFYEKYKSNINENNKKTINIHDLFFEYPKFEGYKSPMCFLNYKKMKKKNLILNTHKPINAYNYLNLFTNNKRYDSIGEFIQNFNDVNNRKISFLTLNINNDKLSTKASSMTSKFSILKNSFSNKTITDKKKQKRLFSSFSKNESNKLILIKDYLCEIISGQKKIIKSMINNKAEEVRSNYQLKTFISDCINDINLENFEIKENNKDDKSKDTIIENNEKLLYILSYIFDNCFSGVRTNIKKLINKTRNNNNYNISQFCSFNKSFDKNKNLSLKDMRKE